MLQFHKMMMQPPQTGRVEGVLFAFIVPRRPLPCKPGVKPAERRRPPRRFPVFPPELKAGHSPRPPTYIFYFSLEEPSPFVIYYAHQLEEAALTFTGGHNHAQI